MGIFDRFRKKPAETVTLAAVSAPPAPPEDTQGPQTGEIGWFGSNLYGSGTWQKYNPDLLLANKGTAIYARMMYDDQVKAALRFKQFSILSRGYYFDVSESEEGEKDEQQQKIADFFEAAIKHLRGAWTDKLVEILDALESGFSISEKIFEAFTFDGKTYWGLKDIKKRPFETFVFEIDEHGNITALYQSLGGKKLTIPMDKVIHFVHHPDKDRIHGESDLRAAYRPWWSKDIAIKFWNIFLERMAAGFTWASVEGNLVEPDKTNLQNTLKNISASTSIMVPSNVSLEQFAPTNTDAFEKAIASHDKAIAKSLLVPNLLGMSEQGSVGSYSQSATQFEAFLAVIDLIADRLAEALNEQLFRELALWNFGTEDFPPFKFQEMSEEKKAKLAEMWSNLISKGAVTKSDNDEAYIRRMIGMPEKSEDAEEEPPMIPGQENAPPDDEEQPDNEGWANEKPEERRDNILRELASKPWMRRVDFKAIEGTLDRYDGALGESMAAVMGKARFSIEQQISKIVGQRSMGNVRPKEIESIYIPATLKSEMRKALRNNLQAVLDKSFTQAKGEVPKKRLADVKFRPGMDKTRANEFLTRRAMKITDVLNQKTLQAVQTVLENGIRYDKSLAQVIQDLGENTDLVQMLPKIDGGGRAVNVPARLETIARTNTAYALNEARTAFFNDPDLRGFVEAFEYSAILDDRTSDVCEALDGSIQKDWGGYTPPNHFNCRSLLVPITQVDDWDGKVDTIPGGVTPQKGFM